MREGETNRPGADRAGLHIHLMGSGERPDRVLRESCAESSNMAEGRGSKRAVLGFETVLTHLKRGDAARRQGWSGVGLRVFMEPGSDPSHPSERASHLSGISSRLYGMGDPGMDRRFPSFTIADSMGQRGVWVPSTTDLFAEDWEIL